jgi:hypothetical protein
MDWPTEYDPSASDPLPTCNCAADHGGFQRSGYVRVGMRLACLACDRVSMCAFGIRIELYMRAIGYMFMYDVGMLSRVH